MEDITIKEVNQLVASDGKEYDLFGYSVALSSDGLVAMVGSDYNNTKARKAGKVYTYSRTTINDNWEEVNQLVASDGKEYDFFGRSVALSSDGLVAIVGADGNNTKANAAGKVYTYSRDTIYDNWVEVNQLVASNGEVRDYFGCSVALSSDGLVATVGAFGSSGKAYKAGKVYTYSRNSIYDNWVEVNRLSPIDGEEYDYFGLSVALSSDGLVAIVGADGSDSKANTAGEVYTYSRNSINDNWGEVNRLVASDGEECTFFGSSVALSSDGLVTMVGASGNSAKATDAGKVYTYSRPTIYDAWVEVNQLIANDGKANDRFGASVALSGDGLMCIVGAYCSDTIANKAGKVYTYTINTNSK